MANDDLLGKSWVDTLNRKWNVIARAGPTSFMVQRPTNDSLYNVTTIMTEVYIRSEIAGWRQRTGAKLEPSIILQGSTKGSWAEMVMEDYEAVKDSPSKSASGGYWWCERCRIWNVRESGACRRCRKLSASP